MSKKIITDSGIEIKPFYTSADLPDQGTENPGEFPYTRGIRADG
jgi:Methylmalonyl-CoA mutase